jgi:25S rRNA (uracil2634-N3)-methyltransferase
VPFVKQDRVLLVGEGDFSFARSLKQHLGLKRVVATCFDGEEELSAKYPRVKENLKSITSTQGASNVEADASGDDLEDEEEWNGFSSPPSSSSSSDESFDDNDFIFREDLLQPPSKPTPHRQPMIHYSINATKLSTTHKKLLSPSTPFSKIVFNFPHVGGLSTDVNRQVRSNQELLVGFFNAAKGLLASDRNPVPESKEQDEQGEDIDFDLETGEPLDKGNLAASNKGQIIVTLFEGEPYSLWNIRDLARHCGLRVVESFRFPWAAYPGYRHARTIGEITGKGPVSGLGSDGKRPGAWRGEEREARMFVLEVREEEKVMIAEEKVEGTGGNEVVLGERRKGKKKKKWEINGEESDGSD